jgi:hypothetical protein
MKRMPTVVFFLLVPICLCRRSSNLCLAIRRRLLGKGWWQRADLGR